MEEFTWTVAVDGYEALHLNHENASNDSAGWLITEKWQSRNRGVRSYAPLRECRGFHRTFAATLPTTVAVTNFTERYGLLGNKITRIFPHGDRPGLLTETKGELVTEWLGECQALMKAVQLWDAIRSRDQRCLETLSRTADAPVPESVELIYKSDLKPAATYLQGIVNARMAALKIQARVVWDLDRALLKNALVPEDLLGALWADFALAIGENKGQESYLNCAACGIFFESGLRKRSDARYCSDACKSKAYRRRSAKK